MCLFDAQQRADGLGVEAEGLFLVVSHEEGRLQFGAGFAGGLFAVFGY